MSNINTTRQPNPPARFPLVVPGLMLLAVATAGTWPEADLYAQGFEVPTVTTTAGTSEPDEPTGASHELILGTRSTNPSLTNGIESPSDVPGTNSGETAGTGVPLRGRDLQLELPSMPPEDEVDPISNSPIVVPGINRDRDLQLDLPPAPAEDGENEIDGGLVNSGLENNCEVIASGECVPINDGSNDKPVDTPPLLNPGANQNCEVVASGECVAIDTTGDNDTGTPLHPPQQPGAPTTPGSPGTSPPCEVHANDVCVFNGPVANPSNPTVGTPVSGGDTEPPPVHTPVDTVVDHTVRDTIKAGELAGIAQENAEGGTRYHPLPLFFPGIRQERGPNQISVQIEQISTLRDEVCYSPDCPWYQKLLNTIERAEDAAYAGLACQQRQLQLEQDHVYSLRNEIWINAEARRRTELAWQTSQYLQTLSKIGWEVANFLAGNPSSFEKIFEEVWGKYMGSNLTPEDLKKGAALTGDKAALKALITDGAKKAIDKALKDGGLPPSESNAISELVVTTITEAIDAGNDKGWSKKHIGSIAYSTFAGYVKGLNEERSKRGDQLVYEMSMLQKTINKARDRIHALNRSILNTRALLDDILAEKQTIEEMASECELERWRDCWQAYDAAVGAANAEYAATLERLDEAEKEKSAEAEAIQAEISALVGEVEAVTREAKRLEAENRELLEEYKRTQRDLNIAKDSLEELKSRRDEFDPQIFVDLYSEWYYEIRDLEQQLSNLAMTAEPIVKRLMELSETKSALYEEYDHLRVARDRTEAELDGLKEENDSKREDAASEREDEVAAAKEALDACREKVSSDMGQAGLLSFTMERPGNRGVCDALIYEARTTFEAVRRAEKPKFVPVACPTAR